MAQAKIVTFLLPDGTEVSNDPRWQAEKMRQKMVEQGFRGTTEQRVATVQDVAKIDAERQGEDVETVEEGVEDDYHTWTADQLKAEVKSRQEQGREIDTTGMRKKSQVVEALRADDAAQAEESEESDNKE